MDTLKNPGPAQMAAGEPARWRWQRLGALLRKESLQILRDPSSLAIAFVLPVMLLFLFGYGVSLDAKNVRVAAVVETPLGHAATSFLQSLATAKDFRLTLARHRTVAEAGLREGRFDGVVVLRSDFEKRIYSPSGSPIQLLVNGVDANRARIVRGYLDGIWLDWLTHYGEETGRRLDAPIALEGRMWFNPAAYSRWFLIPGVIGIIMTLIGALLTALVIAREWERGTMEALLATPLQISEILIGKLVPYFVLGMGGMVVTSVAAVVLFDMPLRGSVLLLLAFSALYMLVALAMGLLISTAARSQFVAGQIAIITSFLPAFILSGFIFDIRSMPLAIQAITHIVPARYYLTGVKTLFLVGDIADLLWRQAAGLFLLGTVFFLMARRRTRRRLD